MYLSKIFMNYSKKIKIFKFIRKFFNFFNLQIFYSKKINYLKNLKIDNVIDVGVANGTDFLFEDFPKENENFETINISEANEKITKKI